MADPPARKSVFDDPDVQAAFSLLTTGGGGTSYLGLPSGSKASDLAAYVDEQTPAAPGKKRAPIYHIGAENLPTMQNWDKTKVSALQTEMVAAGLLTKDYHDGFWDDASAEAFTQVLGQANNSGNPDWVVALKGFVDSQPMEIDPKTGLPRKKIPGVTNRAPLSVTLTSPDDLAATANEVAQRRLGRTFSDQEMQRFVASYQATEQGAQAQQYANQTPGGTGGTTTAPADPKVAASLFAEEVDPVAAQARNMLPLVDSINKMIANETFSTAQPMQGTM